MDDVVIDDPGITSHDPERFACEVCGVTLTYSGRGRYPKRCDEHKSGSKSADGPKRAGRQTAQITESMTQLYEMLGQGLVLVGAATGDEALKGDGVLIDDRAEILAKEWAKLAETDPKVAKALKGLATGGAWGGVVITHAMLLIAMARNHQTHPKAKRERQPKPQPQPRTQRGPEPRPNPAPENGHGEMPIEGLVATALFESGS